MSEIIDVAEIATSRANYLAMLVIQASNRRQNNEQNWRKPLYSALAGIENLVVLTAGLAEKIFSELEIPPTFSVVVSSPITPPVLKEVTT